jgi:hypothetical protein
LQKFVLTVISNENGKSTPIPAHRSKHFLTAKETGKYDYDKYRIQNIHNHMLPLPYKDKWYVYGIAEKTPHKHFEDNYC